MGFEMQNEFDELQHGGEVCDGTEASKLAQFNGGWFGTIVPYAIIVGTIIMGISCRKMIVKAPKKILLSSDHKTVAIISNKLAYGERVAQFRPAELIMKTGKHGRTIDTVEKGSSIKYILDKSGVITSKPLFNSVFGWGKH